MYIYTIESSGRAWHGLDSGRNRDPGSCIQDPESRNQDTGSRILDPASRFLDQCNIVHYSIEHSNMIFQIRSPGDCI